MDDIAAIKTKLFKGKKRTWRLEPKLQAGYIIIIKDLHSKFDSAWLDSTFIQYY